MYPQVPLLLLSSVLRVFFKIFFFFDLGKPTEAFFALEIVPLLYLGMVKGQVVAPWTFPLDYTCSSRVQPPSQAGRPILLPLHDCFDPEAVFWVPCLSRYPVWFDFFVTSYPPFFLLACTTFCASYLAHLGKGPVAAGLRKGPIL